MRRLINRRKRMYLAIARAYNRQAAATVSEAELYLSVGMLSSAALTFRRAAYLFTGEADFLEAADKCLWWQS